MTIEGRDPLVALILEGIRALVRCSSWDGDSTHVLTVLDSRSDRVLIAIVILAGCHKVRLVDARECNVSTIIVMATIHIVIVVGVFIRGFRVGVEFVCGLSDGHRFRVAVISIRQWRYYKAVLF